MALRTGIVTAIHRHGHPSINPGLPDTPCVHVTALEAACEDLTLEERSRLSNLPATFDGDPPPPLTVVTMDTSNHELHVMGVTHGRVHQILREHFLAWFGGANSGDAGAYIVSITGSGTGELLNEHELPDAYGAIVLGTRNSNNAVSAIGKYPQTYRTGGGASIWYQGRMMLDPPISRMEARYGLTNSVTSMTSGIDIGIDNNSTSTTPPIIARAYSSSVATTLTLPHIAVPSGAGGAPPTSWYDLDILLDADLQIGAFWVNGDGPYIITTNLPTVGLIPFIRVRNYSTSRQALYSDLQWVDTLDGVDIRHPLIDPALAMIGT